MHKKKYSDQQNCVSYIIIFTQPKHICRVFPYFIWGGGVFCLFIYFRLIIVLTVDQTN